jgi:hypothetical protein
MLLLLLHVLGQKQGLPDIGLTPCQLPEGRCFCRRCCSWC